MRVLWLLLLAAVASAFEVGKEYVYEYKGTMYVLNPEQRHQLTGVAYRSKVIVQPKPDHTHFKIANFETETFNSEELHLSHHEFHYTPNNLQHDALEHPFAGKFDEGKIEEIELSKHAPVWVKNIKKGVLSLFQLDLDGLHGVCDTLYVVREEGHDYIELTKIKNLEKCDRPHYAILGREVAKKCVKCEAQETHPSSSTSEVYYELKGTAQHYVIEHAWAESGYLFKPHGEGKKIHVKLNRTLDLLEEHDATTDTSLGDDHEKEHSLAQDFGLTGDLKNPDELKHPNSPFKALQRSWQQRKIRGRPAPAGGTWSTPTRTSRRLTTSRAGSQLFLILFNSFASLDYDEISWVYQNHVASAPEGKKDNILHAFLDLLAACRHEPSHRLRLAPDQGQGDQQTGRPPLLRKAPPEPEGSQLCLDHRNCRLVQVGGRQEPPGNMERLQARRQHNREWSGMQARPRRPRGGPWHLQTRDHLAHL
ncbi:hypothetical protein MTO96_014061 [Rhipicephalus appendiculatus]